MSSHVRVLPRYTKAFTWDTFAIAVLFPISNSCEPRRVVVTGAGLITGLGSGWKQNVDGFRTGRVAIRPVRLFDVSRQRVKSAAEADIPEIPATRLGRAAANRLDRAAKMLLIAAHEAWRQSGWESLRSGNGATPPDWLPLVLGTTSGGMTLGEAYYRKAVQTPHSHFRQPTRVLYYQAQRPALEVAEALGIHGPITIIANACASGANAIGHGWHLVATGQAERVLAGGYDALSQLVFAGFDSLQALSVTQCRPFDARRDGLALGEGAAIMALETLESARRRDAEILGEVAGYGAATDGHHLTQPHPQGDAALQSMVAACAAAEVNPGDVQYINAHGTGTPLNDIAEALAINRWAGSHASDLWVSSVKSGIGHLLGAAGAVEAMVCLMALREQWLPPTSTLQDPEPGCAFRLVRRPMDAPVDCVLTNSFGFGGANASLVLRRWQ